MLFLDSIDDSSTTVNASLNRPLAFQNRNHLLPLLTTSFFHQFDIAKHEESLSSTGQSNTDTVGDIQETDLVDEVVADERKDDHIVLLTLVRVNRVNFDSALSHNTLHFLELASEETALAIVEGEHSDMTRLNSVADETIDEVHHKLGLMFVESRLELVMIFMILMVEEVSLKGPKAWDGRAIECTFVVLDFVAVDGPKKASDLGRHTSLHGEHLVIDAVVRETFKQRDVIVLEVVGCFLGTWTKLLMVSNENKVLK